MSYVSTSIFASRQPVLNVASSSPQSGGFIGATPDGAGGDAPQGLPVQTAAESIEVALASLKEGKRGADPAAFQAVLKQMPDDADLASAAVLQLFKAIAGAHHPIVALPPQAGGAQGHAPATDEHRFIDVFTAAMRATVARFAWFDTPELQWHVLEGLPCSEESDARHAQDLAVTRAMMSAWLSLGYTGSPNTNEMAKLVSRLMESINPAVPPSWLDAALAGLLDGYTGPPKAESKSMLSAIFGRGADRIAACEPLIDCLGHQLHRLTSAQIHAVAACLARHLGQKSGPVEVAQGLAHRLLDSLLGYADSRSRQWAAVLTGCRAGLLAAGGERPDKAKAESKSKVAVDPQQQHTQTVSAALDALVTWASKHHAKRVHGREATLRQCARTGQLPQASARHGALQPRASSVTTHSTNNTTASTCTTTSTTTTTSTQPASTVSSSAQPMPAPVLESSIRTDAS